MTRRGFCFHLAALSAGGNDQSLEVYRDLYWKNTEHLDGSSRLIRIWDITFGFEGPPCDQAAVVRFFDENECLLCVGLKTRATYRWVGVPEHPMLSTEERFHWTVEGIGAGGYPWMVGMIQFTDMHGMVRYHEIRRHGGSRLMELWKIQQEHEQQPKPKRAIHMLDGMP